ncbi:acyl-CoA esterase [Streptosporangium jomthongense]|uniref:Alpha/beta fold hydrolase n=1 Tax=Marinobacter aromaticivorans TaxID=1494078 RepID=A0ABW2IUP3_9GAMM|nr:alpha/beta fold hydrolase [Marinobacter aromaticivorans]GGE66891.1 acyl-CoA esterase [Streptosporangium jomthongense]
MTAILNHRITGDGEPLILLHGLFGASENLGAVARQLQADYQVHALDQRNHGSSFHSDIMDYPTMAGDVLAYMDEQGIGKASLLGHSMGGKVAMQLALQAPERVEKLIVADIAPVTYKARHDAVLEGLKQIDLASVRSRRDADRQLAEFVEIPWVRQFLLMNLERIPQQEQTRGGPVYRWRLNLEAIDACYANLAAAPEGDAPYHGPVLFLKGADSAYIQDKHQDEIRRLFPESQLQVIEGTGHWLHAEKTDVVVGLCKQFLSAQTGDQAAKKQ